MIDKNKEYTTRDGHEVRLYATDGVYPYPVHGAVKNKNGWDAYLWNEKGKCFDEKRDLIEKPKKLVKYVHIYPNGCATTLNRKINKRVEERFVAIKRIEIEYNEGEYDE